MIQNPKCQALSTKWAYHNNFYEDYNIPILKDRNTPAAGPNDPRDLNHDGTIDILDARIFAKRYLQ